MTVLIAAGLLLMLGLGFLIGSFRLPRRAKRSRRHLEDDIMLWPTPEENTDKPCVNQPSTRTPPRISHAWMVQTAHARRSD